MAFITKSYERIKPTGKRELMFETTRWTEWIHNTCCIHYPHLFGEEKNELT